MSSTLTSVRMSPSVMPVVIRPGAGALFGVEVGGLGTEGAGGGLD
ncbi:hypothetical protein [Streptomyces sp. 147326]